MRFPHNLWLISALLLLISPAYSETKGQPQVQKISVSAQDPIQLQVQTSAPVATQAQIISDPERLVIDIAGAVPGPGLRGLTVNRNELTRVRVGLFSAAPPVTRIVLDLNSPEWYRITPGPSGFTVNLGAGSGNTATDSDSPPTIGWVTQKIAPTRMSPQASPAVVKRITASVQAPVNGVRVQFAKGLLEIHARNATLSEVLFQIQKQTGAEIAIPAGTEQQRVFVDSGPAPASTVLAELLNGSGLNFVVVGSEANPNMLRSVILSHKTGFADYVPSYTPPPTAANVPGDNLEINQPPVDENPPDDSAPPQPSPN
jgi:AMIN domain